MTISHTSRLRILDHWEHSSADDVSTPIDDINYQYELAFADGSGDGQAQDMYRARRSVLSNDEDALDLAGELTDVFGNTLTFATVKQILVVNLATESGENLLMGGGPDPTGGALITDLFDGDSDARIKIRPGPFLIATTLDGWAVTGGGADVLRFWNDGTGTIEYDIVIKGTRT